MAGSTLKSRWEEALCGIQDAQRLMQELERGVKPSKNHDLNDGYDKATIRDAMKSAAYHRPRLDAAAGFLVEYYCEAVEPHGEAGIEAIIGDLLHAGQMKPSCQKGVVARCLCWACASERARDFQQLVAVPKNER